MTSPHFKTENDLLQRVAAGDERAFRNLVLRYSPLLAPYIFQLTKSHDKTEEIVQDIFLKIWINREALAGIEHFRRYLFIVSRNYALNAIRSFVREEKRRMQWLDEQREAPEDEPPSDYSPLISLLDEAVLQLPEQQRRVWEQVRRHGKKYHEIAAEMGISKETVKKYLQYATRNITHYVREKNILLLIGILMKELF